MSGFSVHTLPFSAPCDAMLTMLVCTTRWFSMNLYVLAYMSMHESCLFALHPLPLSISSFPLLVC